MSKIDNVMDRLINENRQSDIYQKVKNSGPWAVVSQDGNVMLGGLKDYNRAYMAWEKTPKHKKNFIVNVELSTKDFLAVIHFPRTQKQSEPMFKYEKISDTGFTGHWELVKNLGKGKGKEGVY